MFDPEKENDQEDFFNAPAPEEKPKEPKKPELKPEDPDYWEQDETPWEHLRPRRRGKFYLWLALCGIILGLIIAVWIRWFSPSVEEAVGYGYVEKIQKEGMLFKTYEGTILPYREIMDTTRVYRGDFNFSTSDEAIAVRLKMLEGSGYPVRVEYKTYRATLPWRGATVNIITKVDTARADKLLPPDFRPEYVPERPYRKALRELPDSAKIVANHVSDPTEEQPKTEKKAEKKAEKKQEKKAEPKAEKKQEKKAEKKPEKKQEGGLFN